LGGKHFAGRPDTRPKKRPKNPRRKKSYFAADVEQAIQKKFEILILFFRQTAVLYKIFRERLKQMTDLDPDFFSCFHAINVGPTELDTHSSMLESWP